MNKTSIGNSHTHEHHSNMSTEEILSSISRANQIITNVTGRAPRYFVAPYNNYDERVDKIAKDLQLVPVKNRINILNISK